MARQLDRSVLRTRCRTWNPAGWPLRMTNTQKVTPRRIHYRTWRVRDSRRYSWGSASPSSQRKPDSVARMIYHPGQLSDRLLGGLRVRRNYEICRKLQGKKLLDRVVSRRRGSLAGLYLPRTSRNNRRSNVYIHLITDCRISITKRTNGARGTR